MIILLSPAKTFEKIETKSVGTMLFHSKTYELIEKIKAFNVNTLKAHFKVSDKISLEVFENYQKTNQFYEAIETFNGVQYKAFDFKTLSLDAKNKTYESVLIFSGLYGIIRPNDYIFHYRLDIKDSFMGNLYDYWHLEVTNYLKSLNDELIIDLTSDEYKKMISKDIHKVSIIFINENGKKAPSVEAKKMRGLFARYLVQNPINDIADLEKISINNYIFDKSLSNNNSIYYKKISL